MAAIAPVVPTTRIVVTSTGPVKISWGVAWADPGSACAMANAATQDPGIHFRHPVGRGPGAACLQPPEYLGVSAGYQTFTTKAEHGAAPGLGTWESLQPAWKWTTELKWRLWSWMRALRTWAPSMHNQPTCHAEDQPKSMDDWLPRSRRWYVMIT